MIKLLARREDWSDSIGILICERDISGNVIAVAHPVLLTRREPGASIIEPSLRLEFTAAQALMDELWECGIRPSEGSGSAGALAAVKYHLEDMRKLVFSNGGVKA